MRTVPLRGAKAAGRVALVDDEDYDLVMQYKWYVHESKTQPGRYRKGPYAVTNVGIWMHCLILGVKGVDHIDHNTLNNQRHNLRAATGSQNNQNRRGNSTGSSRYKGVSWDPSRLLWSADIKGDRKRHLGRFDSELEAAYVYDAAARELFGEYAYTNFEDGPTLAMLDQWKAQREERKAVGALIRAQSGTSSRWWAQREPMTCACKECGAEYQTRRMDGGLYCPDCRRVVNNRRAREKRRRQREGMLF